MANVSLIRHATILIKYKAKRVFNTIVNFQNKKKSSPIREATRPKTTKTWILFIVFIPFFIIAAFGQSEQINLKVLAQLNQRELYAPDKQYFPAWRCDELHETFKNKKGTAVCIPAFKPEFSLLSRRAHGNLTLIFFVVFVGVLLFGLAEKNFIKSDSDFEWLSTLPIAKNNLICMKFLEKTILNGSGLFLLLPLIASLTFKLQSPFYSSLVTLFLYLGLMFICAMIQVFAQLGLKLLLPLSKLKNFHAVLSLVSFVPLFFILMIPAGFKPFLLKVDLASLAWLKWSPFDLAIKIISTTNMVTAWISIGILIFEIGLIYIVISKSLSYLLTYGVSGLSHQETTSKLLVADKIPQPSFFTRWLTPIQRNELRLLFRDKTFFARTLLVPIVIMGLNLYVGMEGEIGTVFSSKQLGILSLAPLYTFLFSLMPMMAAENQTFWLAKTFPVSLSDYFRQKINLWIGLAYFLPAAFVLYFMAHGARINLNVFLILLAIMCFTVTYAYIAAGIAIVGSNAYNETNGFGPVKGIYSFCYLALVSAATSSITNNEAWPIITTFIISLITAKALWQKANQEFPYLLDSVTKPMAIIGPIDGVLAVSAFTILQMIIGLILTFFLKKSPAIIPFIAFTCAGFFTCVSAIIIYAKDRPSNFPRLINKNFIRSIYYGVIGGLAGVVIGIVYLNFIISKNYFSESINSAGLKFSYWMFATTVICAPLFEEYIFRGMLFNGLRQNRKPLYSILTSALLFAVIHPPVSVVPVFIMGVLTAVAYELTGSLLASILIHAIYNFAMVSSHF